MTVWTQNDSFPYKFQLITWQNKSLLTAQDMQQHPYSVVKFATLRKLALANRREKRST